MADRPIIFYAPMIRALLDGRKTQTRRVLKPQPLPMFTEFCGFVGPADEARVVFDCLPPAPPLEMKLRWNIRDRLWVREGHAFGWPIEGNQSFPECNQAHAITYRADGNRPFGGSRWQSPIHMPRWASRLTLTVTDVRVQRLQDISEADSFEEGCNYRSADGDLCHWGDHPSYSKMHFQDIWNSLHGPDAWGANPWVAALTFDVHRGNIDQ